MAIQNDPIYLLPEVYTVGLTVSNNTTTPNTKLNIAAGQCRDFTNSIDMPLGTSAPFGPPINGSTTAAPLVLDATTTGANGLDTGSLVASKVYGVYIIGDSRYIKPIACLLSLDSSTTPPQLPFGYDSFRQCGYGVTDASSHFLKAYCFNAGHYRKFIYDAPQATAITAGAATSYTAIDLSALVPQPFAGNPNIPTYIQAKLTPNAANDTLKLQPANGTGDAVTINGQVTTVPIYEMVQVMAQIALTVPTINYKVSSGSAAAAINVCGFEF